ncbi:MAG: hydrolase Nlp/P60 [Bacteroidetes bacterium]|nr:MAG: hydrolase Nlp/P60 [Bacteroidota bacterium]
MPFAICTVAIMPLRVSSDDRSEMVSQVLFGESMEILEYSGLNWAHIRMAYDNYEGWVDPKQFTIIDDAEFNSLDTAEIFYLTDIFQSIENKKTKSRLSIVLGSNLPNLKNKKFLLAGNTFKFDGNSVIHSIKPTRKTIVDNAMKYINAPYLWGGKTPFGVDCSGFSQTVYKLSGVKLLRDASLQADQGETINFITDAKEGDLAFFDNEEGNIIHVGIILEGNRIIHASGVVRIDKIDHQGIFNVNTEKYTHKLRLVKTYI